jgi:hypothetical protein
VAAEAQAVKLAIVQREIREMIREILRELKRRISGSAVIASGEGIPPRTA